MKPTIAVILVAAIVSGCRDSNRAPAGEAGFDDGGTDVAGGVFRLTSENAPGNAAEALKIVGIRMDPPPEVLHCDYEAGMDDSMNLVIRLPADRAAEFWSAGPWNKAKAYRASGDGTLDRDPRINEFGDVEWLKWKRSSSGWAAHAKLSDGECSYIYAAEDIEDRNLLVFIFWHET